MPESFIRCPSPTSTSSQSGTRSLDSRLQSIEGKLDRVLHALSELNDGSQSSHGERNKKCLWASSPSCQSDACDDDERNQTTDGSEGLNERKRRMKRMRVESSSTSETSCAGKALSEPLAERSSDADSMDDFIVSDGP
ncbi:hypothetical protein FIBSPDRAFT_890378 [Athelia psychrophila]|uniref:Uncharacterized protein n=1 Tax=Athelia psychrophila TaxID=1759441 RepID=A0A166L254_9AGAM|nr:hypothetical protein FIBSPDRAFT_890378 [Fibularhizoctonia sp. CBS 109695]